MNANPNKNEQSKKQKHKQSNSKPEVKIQPGLYYKLECKQLNYNRRYLN